MSQLRAGGAGSGVMRTPMTSGRLPLTPRSGNTPYVRQQPRNPSDSSSGGAFSGRRSTLENSSGSGIPTESQHISQLLDEIRKGREEQKGMREDIRKMSHIMTRLEDKYQTLSEQIKQQEEASFSIESSPYKEDLLKEVAVMYVRSLLRQPSRQEIGEAIMKVLRQDGKNKQKFMKARTFIYNKLTDHRCEERRRLFAQRPCEIFGSLTTKEFVDRFMGTLKAPSEYRTTYIRHLALLRKFARESQDSKNDTFKKYRKWVDDTFAADIPTEQEWQRIMEADDAYQYDQSVYQVQYNTTEIHNTEGFDTGHDDNPYNPYDDTLVHADEH